MLTTVPPAFLTGIVTESTLISPIETVPDASTSRYVYSLISTTSFPFGSGVISSPGSHMQFPLRSVNSFVPVPLPLNFPSAFTFSE